MHVKWPVTLIGQIGAYRPIIVGYDTAVTKDIVIYNFI